MFLSERRGLFGCHFCDVFCLKKEAYFGAISAKHLVMFCLKKEAYLGAISAKHFVMFFVLKEVPIWGAISVKHFVKYCPLSFMDFFGVALVLLPILSFFFSHVLLSSHFLFLLVLVESTKL